MRQRRRGVIVRGVRRPTHRKIRVEPMEPRNRVAFRKVKENGCQYGVPEVAAG
jgi:hypothetical protein